MRIGIVFRLFAEDGARLVGVRRRLVIEARDAIERAGIGRLDCFRARHFQRDDLARRLASGRDDIEKLG